MHLATKIIKHTGDRIFTLRPIGDVHKGTRHCDVKHFLRDIEAIKGDPDTLWLGMGDYCENIVPTDPRFVGAELDPEFLPHLGTIAVAQRDSFLADVMPIKDKCIGMLEGNHEFEIRRRHYLDMTLDLCRELECDYLGDTAFIRLVFHKVDETGRRLRSCKVVIYAEHGAGGGALTGGKINALTRMMKDFEANIYLRGHVHVKGGVKEPRLSVPDHGAARLVSQTRVAALTGCYYRTYEENQSSYGQRKSYPPTELGSIAIRIDTRNGDLELVN